MERKRVADLSRATALAVVYILLARFGLTIHAVSSFATLVWPPTGVALAAMLVFGYRFWPAIAVGAFVANLWTGAPAGVALGISAGNTLEALLGAWALRRIPGFSSSLDRLQDVLGLIVLAAVGSSIASATIGVSSLVAGGIVSPARFALTWRTWWLGDAIGDLIVAPLLLTWPRPRMRLPGKRVAEAAALAVLLALASYLIFERTHDGMASLLSPLLIWAAIRFEQRGAVAATFLVSCIAVWATTRGHGPFMRGTVEEGLFLLQTFMALTAATFLVLAALTSERRRAAEERVSAEDRIRESERRYHTLADAVDHLLWINDPAGDTIYVNRHWLKSLGASDISGRDWSRLIHPEDRDRLFDMRRRAVDAAEPYQAEIRLRTKDGVYRWMLARVVPVKDASGRVTSWVGSAADIHHLKTVEEEMRRARDQAQAANRAKDQFLASLSHELRTPLTPVLGLTSLLERRDDLPEDALAQIESVRRNAELEARLIDDLLDLTGIARGKIRIQPEAVDLSEILEHAVEICREEAVQKGVALEREPARVETLIRGDPARLRQVFWNLVKNAIKFTPAGGRIRLRALSSDSGRIAVEVADTGAGIPASQLARIFEPFEQAGPRAGGLGLGLAISSALVRAHGGTLTAESPGSGRGATFRVELPISPEPSPPPRPPDPLAASVDAPAGTRRVLLIEDHGDTLRALSELLAELSCEVVLAASVQEALAAAQDQTFDLVLSDVGLPDGSGLELMRQLKDRYGLSGIAISGYGMEEDRRRSREAGFVDHLVKPITFQQLATAIDRFFSEPRRSKL